MRQKEMTETHYHISKPTACFMLDLNDLKMYEDKIRTKEEQKAKEKQEKKLRNEGETKFEHFSFVFCTHFYREIIF
mgnify:CR=1 FL=1